jgi:hypothetical protein
VVTGTYYIGDDAYRIGVTNYNWRRGVMCGDCSVGVENMNPETPNKERHFDDEHGYFGFLKPKTMQDLVLLGVIVIVSGALVCTALVITSW